MTATLYRPGQLHAADGVQIATYSWLPESGRPRALVQIAHGAAEHALRYDRFARYLVAQGYGAIASDHRGHGATAQATGGFGVAETPAAAPDADYDSWRAIVEDLRAVGDQARLLHPGVPVVLLGHSLGAMLGRHYAQEYADDLNGLVLFGAFRTLPGARQEEALARLEREVAENGRDAPSSYLPDLFASFNDPYPHRTGFEWLSRDEGEVDAYAVDERCGFALSAGLALDWVRAVDRINEPDRADRTPADLPVHVAVGTEDPCHQGLSLVYELLEEFRRAGTEDLSWKRYQGARHEILNETNREEVQEDLVSWLDKHV
ncbi:alpha/beta fold hydrolase [Streptomyces sp. NPDC059176]|uniref:alpha/beta fold hydrolase n=1 Tax=unclassified Streptomyces TaxID=2593676 RepID=UPI00367A6B9C